MRAVFICKEHEEYGTMGFRPKNMPGFDPLSGMGVAHDFLEHPLKPDESLAGEVQAFGAMMYVRGEDYYHQKGQITTSPGANFAYELAELLMKAHWGNIEPLQHCLYGHRIMDESVRQEINDAIRYVREALKSEWDDEIQLDARTESNIRGWLAHGYRSAKRRYWRVKRYQLLDLFQSIEKQADEILKSGNYGEPAFEGQEMTICVRFKKSHEGLRYPQLTIKLIQEEDYD